MNKNSITKESFHEIALRNRDVIIVKRIEIQIQQSAKWIICHIQGWFISETWSIRKICQWKSPHSLIISIDSGKHWINFNTQSWFVKTVLPNAKNLLIGRDSDAGKFWSQEEKGKTEDDTVHSITDSDLSLSKLWDSVMYRKIWLLQSMGCQRVRHDWVTELNW